MRSLACAAALAAGLWCVPAGAADLGAPLPVKAPSAPPVSEWEFQATVYGWLTAINGDVGVRRLPPVGVDISASDALKNLDGALMGSFLAKKGDWTFLADLIYTDVSSEKSGAFGIRTGSFGMQQTIFQGLAGYKLPLGLPDTVELSGTVGFRYQHYSGNFAYLDLAGPSYATTDGTHDWVDPTVGLLLQYQINDKWFFNALADVGGFGVASKITAQGFAALGYMWTPQISTAIGYRAIYTDYENDGFVYDVTQHGAFISLAYHF